MAAANEAVWRNGGSSPQKVQCGFGSLSPSRSSVKAATTPSRLGVSGKHSECQRTMKLKTNIEKEKI
jgi:hypothetical protein